MKDLRDPIHVLVIEDTKAGYWSAQCLEYDIATQAKTLTALMNEVQRVLTAHVELSKKLKIEPFASLKSAPAAFWKLYYRSTTTSVQPLLSAWESISKAPIEGRIAALQPC